MPKKKKTKPKMIRKLIKPAKPAIDYLAAEVAEKKKIYEAERTRDYVTRWEKGLKYIEQRTPPRKHRWQSNAFMPITYRDFMTIMCRVEDTLLGPIPTVKLVGNPNDNEEQYLSYRMRKSKGLLAASDILWESGAYGTGFGKVICDSAPQIIYRRVKKETPGKNILERASGNEEPEYEEVQQLITTNIGPTPYWIPLHNIFCNANETGDIQEADIIEVKPTNLHHLVNQSRNPSLNPHNWMFGRYDNVEKIVAMAEATKGPKGTSMGEDIKQSVQDPQYGIRALRKEGLITRPKFNITLFIFQGDYKHGGKYYRNGEIVICEFATKKTKAYTTLRGLPCRRSDGRKDYFQCGYERVPGRLYHRSIPDSLFRLQENMNDIVRSIFDRDKLSLHSPMAYDVNRVDNPKLLQWRMGGLMPVNGPPEQFLMPQKIDPSHPGVWRIVELLSMYSMEASGATKSIAGAGDAANRTATGISRIMAAAEARIKSTVLKMSNGFINDLGDSMHCSLKDNFDEIKDQEKGNVTFSFVNNKGKAQKVELKREDISDNVDVYAPNIFERVDRQQTAREMKEMLQYVASLIGQDNLLEVCKTIWDFSEWPGSDKLFQPDQQSVPLELVSQYLSQKGINPGDFGAFLNAASQQMQAGGGGGGGGKQGPAAQPAQNQGTAMTQVASTGQNTGRGG